MVLGCVSITQYFLQVEQQYTDDDSQGGSAEAASSSQAAASSSQAAVHGSAAHGTAEACLQDQEGWPGAGPGLPESHAELHSTADEGEGTGDVDGAYIMAYLSRHCCYQQSGMSETGEAAVCGGTMTPVGVHGSVYACNMCGHERLESERISELEKMHEAVTAEEAARWTPA